MAITPTTEDAALLIGGLEVKAQTGKRFEVKNPANGQLVGTAADADAADVTAAVDAAAAAFPAWSRMAAVERARVLRDAATAIRESAAEIARVMTAEQGKPLAESRGEMEITARFFDWFGGEAERVYGQIVPPMNPADRVSVVRQPLGVVAAITPWNFPAAMMARKLAPAMAAGCTSVVKPASATPLTAAMVLRAIEEAGSPPGVANLITSSNAGLVAETLFGDRRVRKVSFTGSTEVGKELIRLSAGQVKRLSLELGGHAPFIVFDDADVEAAIEGLMTAKFRNAGQACVSANRVYVQEGIHDRFTATLAERVARLSVGPGDREGVDVGPLIDDRAVDKADEHVRDALGAGAELMAGGRRPDGDQYGLGSFYEPTLLLNADAGMLVSREETFGPVCAITRFTDEEEVIRLANDSVYGLAAYLYTRENARLTRVSERLDYGIVGVNTGLIAAPNTPFGGVKESGFGREGGSVGIDEYVDVKYVLIGGVGA